MRVQTIHLHTITQDQIEYCNGRTEYSAKVAISERMALYSLPRPSRGNPANPERDATEHYTCSD